jgi:hypothetical protein
VAVTLELSGRVLDMLQASPAALAVQASMATWGGVWARPQSIVAPSRAVTQVPVWVSPSGSVAVQASPRALLAQASTSAWGGAGGFGAQATVAPSSEVTQLPAVLVVVVVPSVAVLVAVRVQAAPAARLAQASTWACAGVQSSVPLAVVAEAMAVARVEAVAALVFVALVVSDVRLDWAQPAMTSPMARAVAVARRSRRVFMRCSRADPAAVVRAGGAGVV